MVHLLCAAKLKPSISAATFSGTIRQLSASLEQQLLSTTGLIGKRCPHPIVDTDEADLDTFFIMSFKSRAQLEEAVPHMTGSEDLSLIRTDNSGVSWTAIDSPVGKIECINLFKR